MPIHLLSLTIDLISRDGVGTCTYVSLSRVSATRITLQSMPETVFT